MDVTFKARSLDEAVAIAHHIAEILERQWDAYEVTLGENYRVE